MDLGANFNQLIFAAVEKAAPDVAESFSINKVSLTGAGIISLLNALLIEKGPESLLQLLISAPLNISASWFLFFLLNSSRPAEAIAKLSQQVCFEPGYRIELIEEGKNHLVVASVTPCWQKTVVARELFVCGALRYLLSKVGCKELTVEWEEVAPNALPTLRDIGISAGAVNSDTRWVFRWQCFERPEQIDGLDELFLSNVSTPLNWREQTLRHAVETKIQSNLAKRPSIVDIAEQLGISARTLQRGLERENTSFSRIVSEVRMNEAEGLLHFTDISITQVAHLTGFSDSAHFAREFNRVYGMTPGAYRKMLMVSQCL